MASIRASFLSTLVAVQFIEGAASFRREKYRNPATSFAAPPLTMWRPQPHHVLPERLAGLRADYFPVHIPAMIARHTG